MADPTITALMHANLYEVFGQRDPVVRREAIARIYTDDVGFTDDGGKSSDSRPSTTAYSSFSKTPPQLSSPPTGPSMLAKKPLRWPGAWDPQTVSQSHVVSTSRLSKTIASARFERCLPSRSRLPGMSRR